MTSADFSRFSYTSLYRLLSRNLSW